jgi:adenylate cyclase
MNPRFCSICEHFARTHPGGVELELSMLFADIRGSTTLAETMGTAEFTQLINRFFMAATNVLVKSDGLIDRLRGDEVFAVFLPLFAGANHSRVAVEAAQALLHATGHGESRGPWVPVGVGVHTGVAFLGTVGSQGVTDLTALGDAVNTASRLASLAGPGEVLVSDATCAAAGLDRGSLESRRLELKGRIEPIDVCVIQANADKHHQARA